MSIVTSASVLAFLEQTADDSFGTIAAIQAGVEQSIKNYCGRDIEDATYKEFYSGSGTDSLLLRQYPINSITRVSLGKIFVMNIKNTNQFTTASVSVTNTAVVLQLDGGATSTITFASNATIGAVVTAINAIGSGWVAALQTSDYGAYKSSYLFPSGGKEAIYGQLVHLEAPQMLFTDYNDIHPDAPIVYRISGWPAGRRNIYVEYNAGYATVPDDLQYAVKILIQVQYAKHCEESFGLGNYSVAGISKGFEGIGVSAWPNEVLVILEKYRRKSI